MNLSEKILITVLWGTIAFTILLIIVAGISAWLKEPNCEYGGNVHNWYGPGWLYCSPKESRLPGDRVREGNNGPSERGWAYRYERRCIDCNRREYECCSYDEGLLWVEVSYDLITA